MAEAKTDTAVKAKKTAAAPKAAAPKKAPAAAKAEKPAVTKPAAKTASKKPAAAKAAAKPRASKSKLTVTPEQRYMMICEAAYYRAERRSFSPENEIQDWLDAEAEINRLLGM